MAQRAERKTVKRETIDDRLKKVKQQGYKAAKENKIFPRELQNTNGLWEDAELYDRKTRQGQEHNRQHMKNYIKAYEEAFGKKNKKK